MLKRLKFVDGSQARKLTLLILFTNMTLSTLLILTVCRMSVIHELCSKSPSPQSLCGSVVEHWSSKAQLEFLMGTQISFFDPRSWQDEKHFSLFLYRAQNLSSFLFDLLISYLFYFYSYWDKSKSDRSFLKNDGDGSNWVKWAFNNVSNAQAMLDNKSEYLVQSNNNNGLWFELGLHQVLLNLKCFHNVKFRTLR